MVSIPVLLLTLGGIELAHWFHVRQMVGLALVQAARAGATQHAQPAVIAQAFEQALRPLFAGATPHVTDTRLATAMHKRSHAMGNKPPWQIRILRPDTRDFAQFPDPTLTIARRSRLPAIRNDYQYEQQQHRTHVKDGNTSAEAQTTVFQANTLVLQLRYPHPPLLPGVARMMASLHSPTDAYARNALAAGLLPMLREVHLEMASHPVDWPSLPDGRVIKGAALMPAHGSSHGNTPCIGLWCQSPQPLPRAPTFGRIDRWDTNDLPAWNIGKNNATDELVEDELFVDPNCP